MAKYIHANQSGKISLIWLNIFQAKELEDFCFKFSLNHMTAVTQTEAFSKLDEGTVKDFITKVLCAWTTKTSFVDPDPNCILIQSGQWIRIQEGKNDPQE
jgi:hypothetical protein